MSAAPLPRLHLVTDDAVLTHPGFVPAARALLLLEPRAGSGVALHLRGPNTPSRRLLALAREILAPPSGHPSPRLSAGRLVASERVELALVLRAESGGRGRWTPDPGLHLPRRALPPDEVRALGWSGLLGMSVRLSDPPVAPPVDYLVGGTLFPTPSHPGHPGVGVERLARWLAGARADPAGGPPPVLGIGGVTPERVTSVMEAGAHGVAVLRGVWSGMDLPGADPVNGVLGQARRYLDAVAEALASSQEKEV